MVTRVKDFLRTLVVKYIPGISLQVLLLTVVLLPDGCPLPTAVPRSGCPPFRSLGAPVSPVGTTPFGAGAKKARKEGKRPTDTERERERDRLRATKTEEETNRQTGTKTDNDVRMHEVRTTKGHRRGQHQGKVSERREQEQQYHDDMAVNYYKHVGHAEPCPPPILNRLLQSLSIDTRYFLFFIIHGLHLDFGELGFGFTCTYV